MAGEDYLIGLDRRRADVAGAALAPVVSAPSTTAATLAKRFDTARWHRVETALGHITGRVLGRLDKARRDGLLVAATIDIDATDVEVYGSRKQGISYNYKGQRAGRPHLATWAEAGIVLAADLLAGDEDPRAGWSTCSLARWAVCPPRPHPMAATGGCGCGCVATSATSPRT